MQIGVAAPRCPRLKSGGRAWGVHVNPDGLLEGSEQPAPRDDVQQLLQKVLHERHELTEDEIVTLFEVRGADFEAVCSAAGAPTLSFNCLIIGIILHSSWCVRLGQYTQH